MTKHNPRKPKSDADGSDPTDLDAVRAFLHGGGVAEDVDDDPEPPPRPRLPRKVEKMIEEAVRTSGFLSGKERPHKYTKLGAKCSRVWQDDWIERVEKTETELGRPICGARTMAGTPCTLGSNHPSGRCRFHGGFDLTGAPKGNRNAVLHGLYSRRLQVCGTHCPQWESCPCAGDDVLALPLKERPTCPYEQTEYNTVLTNVLAKIELSPDPDPLDKHNAHTLALLHVMMSRAATAMRNQQLIETTTASTDTYQMQSSRQNPCLQAYLRIASEYRRFHAILDYPLHPICASTAARPSSIPSTPSTLSTARRAKPQAAQKPEPGQGLPYIPSLSSIMGHVTRALHDTDLTPEGQQNIRLRDIILADHAERLLEKARQFAAQSNDTAMLDAFERAHILNPLAALREEPRMLAAYRPRHAVLPKAAAQKIIDWIKQKPP